MNAGGVVALEYAVINHEMGCFRIPDPVVVVHAVELILEKDLSCRAHA